MSWLYTPYLVSLFLSASVIVLISVLIWRRRAAPGAAPAIFLLLAMAEWTLAHAIQLDSTDLGAKVVLYKIQYLSMVIIPAAWLIFILHLTGKERWLTRWLYLLLSIEPMLVVLLTFTNDIHKLMWNQVSIQPGVQLAGLDLSYGMAFEVHAVYSFFLVIIGLILLASAFFASQRVYRGRNLTLLVAGSLPLLTSLAYLSGLSVFPHLDFTPFAFAVSSILLAWTLYRFWLFDIIPIARSAVLDNMKDGVFVLDLFGRIVDLNLAGSKILRRPIKEIIEQPASQVFAPWPNLPVLSSEPNNRQFNPIEIIRQVSLKQGDTRSFYEVRISPLIRKNGQLMGRLLIWSQVNERRQAEQALRRQLDELAVLHAVATACVEASSEEDLIQNVTEIISRSLFTDNFGIILVDEAANTLRFTPSYRGLPEELKATLLPIGVGVTGQVAKNGVSRLVPDVASHPGYKKIYQLSQTRSELCVPIKVGERVLGVINAESSLPDIFSEADERLLSTLAGQLATAIERLRAETAGRHRIEELLAITRVSHEITSVLNVKQVLNSIVRHAAELSNSDASGVFAYRPDGRFYLLATYGVNDDFITTVNAQGVPAQGSAVGRAYAERCPVQIPDVLDDPDYATQSLAALEQIRAILALPILRGEEVIGGIVLWHRQPCRFTAEEIVFLQALAQQSVNAIENARLFEETQHRLGEVTLLSKVIALTAAAGDISSALTQVCTEVAHFFKLPQAAFALLNSDCTKAEIIAEYHASDRPTATGVSIPVLGNPSMTYILEHKTPLAIADAQSDPLLAPVHAIMRQRQVASIVLISILIGEKVTGTLGIDSLERRDFNHAEITLLQNIASQVGQVLERLQLFEETRRRAIQQEALNAIIAAVVTAPDLARLLDAVLDLTLQALKVEKGGVWIAGHALMRGFPRQIRESMKNVAQSIKMEINSTICINDWEQIPDDHPLKGFIDLMSPYGIKASLTVPVLSEGRRIGGFSLASDSPKTWLAEEIALVEAVGRQVGTAVERHNLLAKTQEQARQVQQIMDTVPEGVLLLDSKHRIVLANPTAWQQLSELVSGFTNDQPLSQLGGRDIEEILKLDPSTPWQDLESLEKPKRTFETAARPLESEAQNAGWVLVLHDVTQEHENRARIQMQDRLATVGQLAAGIAHDFNNIMAAIMVYTDLLTVEPNLSHPSRDRLTIIQKQVQRATSLIRQILDFSRRSVMEQSSLDLLPFIKELDKLLGRVLPENIRLELTYQPGAYRVHADPTRLQQVFMNLALNARDAMPEGGMLHFEVSRFKLNAEETPPFAELTPGEWVRIEVRDTGAGAQVYGIIKQHGGSIDVQSQAGRGASFIIYLPALENPEEQAVEPNRDTSFKGSGETVLVVEDDWAAREAIQAMLEAQNYHPLSASNGLEALRIYEQTHESIAAVVSDVVMPEI